MQKTHKTNVAALAAALRECRKEVKAAGVSPFDVTQLTVGLFGVCNHPRKHGRITGYTAFCTHEVWENAAGSVIDDSRLCARLLLISSFDAAQEILDTHMFHEKRWVSVWDGEQFHACWKFGADDGKLIGDDLDALSVPAPA